MPVTDEVATPSAALATSHREMVRSPPVGIPGSLSRRTPAPAVESSTSFTSSSVVRWCRVVAADRVNGVTRRRRTVVCQMPVCRGRPARCRSCSRTAESRRPASGHRTPEAPRGGGDGTERDVRVGDPRRSSCRSRECRRIRNEGDRPGFDRRPEPRSSDLPHDTDRQRMATRKERRSMLAFNTQDAYRVALAPCHLGPCRAPGGGSARGRASGEWLKRRLRRCWRGLLTINVGDRPGRA